MRRLRSTYCLLVFFSLFGKGWSQPYRAEVPQSRYIHADYAQWETPGSSHLLDGFFAKMRRLMLAGEGQIRIAHFGGSHIQADIYSNRLRQHLATYFPEQMACRGMVFPFTMAKTNNPYDYKVNYAGKWNPVRNVNKSFDNRLGVMGISVSTTDTNASFEISFDKRYNVSHTFTRVKVFHELDSLAYEVKWLGKDSVSIQHFPEKGYSLIELPEHRDTVQIGFSRTDSLQNRFILFGVLLENDDPGYVYTSIGVNGASTSSYLKCELFGLHMESLNPDVVFFGIGINDAHGPNFTKESYMANYEQIIRQIKAVNPNVLLVFITNNDSYGYNKKLNTNADVVREAMRELARRHHGVLWDLYGVMGGLKSSNNWKVNGLMKSDRIHFMREGYVLIGDLLFNSLMERYEQYLLNAQ
jgi:lysophospholipase L1-like esterase